MKPQLKIARNVMNLRQGRNDWYSVKAQADGAVVSIYDEIGYFGVTAQDFAADIGKIKGDIELHINSPGGEVFDGLAIYNSLSQRAGNVRVVVDSLAASICSVIAQAASPGQLVMAKSASMMIHDGFGLAVGNAADMRKMAGVLDEQSGIIAQIYADRSGKPAAQWREAMVAETWYGAQAAVDAGLADEVQAGREQPPQNNWDLSIYSAQGPQDEVSHPDVPDLGWFDPAMFREAFKGGK